HPFVEDFTMEVVFEGEARGDGVVGPGLLATWFDEEVAAPELGEERFDVIVGSLRCGGHLGRRELAASDAGRRQDNLFVAGQTLEGMPDELADVAGDA